MVLSDYLVAQKRIERMTKEAGATPSGRPSTRHRGVRAGHPASPGRHPGRGGAGDFGFPLHQPDPDAPCPQRRGGRAGGEPYPELSKAAEEAKARWSGCARKWRRRSPGSPPRAGGVPPGDGDRPECPGPAGPGAFDAMEYISFITVGRTRCARGTSAGDLRLGAAGRIHSDLEKGFIRAEVIPCEDFLRCGSMAKARTEGKLRLEGKEYIVKDGRSSTSGQRVRGGWTGTAHSGEVPPAPCDTTGMIRPSAFRRPFRGRQRRAAGPRGGRRGTPARHRAGAPRDGGYHVEEAPAGRRRSDKLGNGAISVLLTTSACRHGRDQAPREWSAHLPKRRDS